MKQAKLGINITAIDLFCGIGGLTHGFKKAGLNVVAGYDIDHACKWAYEKNNGHAKFHAVDIAELPSVDIKSHFRTGAVSLLAGCAPCQPFSSYSLSKTDETDQRWSMIEHFGRLVTELRPTLVAMENVPQLRKHIVFENFESTLKKAGYWISTEIVRCSDYGIPQSRTRLVLLASLLGEIHLRPRDPKRDRKRSVRHVISHLQRLKAGEASKTDPIHRASKLNKLNMERIKAAKPGGTWREWNKRLVAACHQEDSGKTFPGVYGRMEWDRPAPTITTQFYGFGNGRFGHPKQHRALSLREGALIQTFPARYAFVKKGEPIHMTTIGRLIGNAVPVKLGQVIGESFIQHIKSIKAKK